jgi:hypothetical protein
VPGAVGTVEDTGTSFEENFVAGALRLDVVHAGSASDEKIFLRRVVLEPVWGGPRVDLASPAGMGEYRIDARDRQSGTLIFSRGFSSLFREWATTAEAETTQRAFEECYELPTPKRPVDVEVSARTSNGVMKPVFRVAIDPRSKAVGRVSTAFGTVATELITMGPPETRVDLVIVGDGYTAEEKRKFEKDCEHIVGEFFDVEPMKSHREEFNVRAVFAPSRESGVDEPRKGIFRDTPFGMSFNTFGLERYCMTENLWAVHDAVSGVPHDAIFLMANSSRYGGGAIYNFYTAFVSDNEYDDYLCVHEFGHGFAGLGDEYFDSRVSYNEFYPRGVEPWEPNITALLPGDSLKWAPLMREGTPVPTPADDPRYRGEVGAFEGAGYAAKGLYRPAVDCKMFSKANRAFCPVCARGIIDAIRRHAPE